MGRDFGWLWRAYTISIMGTRIALDAFPFIAILALHVSEAQVSFIAAAGGVVATLLAVPLGPWVEFRRKRPLMIHTDLVRFAALATVPAAYFLGVLTYYHLLAVAIVVAVADIVFIGASGPHLKALVPAQDLLTANGRFENVMWISTAVGPPLGGWLIGVLGPVVTMALDAVSFLLSALGIRMIKAPEPEPPAKRDTGTRLSEGWRAIFGDPGLRWFFANTVLVSALIMATAPLLTYLMLRDLAFTTFEYGLALGIPCLGGIVGARIARPLASRFGQRTILLGFGVARALWLTGLAFVGPGVQGLLLVIVVEMAMITCMGVFMPVFATYRLQRAPEGRIARVLTAWTISTRAVIAIMTALWGVLASLTSARTAIAIAGVLLMATAVLLPWRRQNWASTESSSAEEVTTAAT